MCFVPKFWSLKEVSKDASERASLAIITISMLPIALSHVTLTFQDQEQFF